MFFSYWLMNHLVADERNARLPFVVGQLVNTEHFFSVTAALCG